MALKNQPRLFSGACGDVCGCGWAKIRLLGRGAHGSVYLSQLENSGEQVAVKQVMIDGMNDRDLAGALQNEISMIKELQHPNIVRYLGTTQCGNCLNIVLEYCPCGSLRQMLQREGALNETTSARFTRQILSGMLYLHNNGIAHRDVKGANVLVADDGTMKLADFGASKRLTHESVMSGLKGTPHWMAPEIIKGQQTAQGWKSADVWSIGCTVVEMLTGKMPWPMYPNPVAAMYHIANGERPPVDKQLSEVAQDFINKCCTHDPAARPTVKDLLNHPFILLADDNPASTSNTYDLVLEIPETSPRSTCSSCVSTLLDCSHSFASVFTKPASPCSSVLSATESDILMESEGLCQSAVSLEDPCLGPKENQQPTHSWRLSSSHKASIVGDFDLSFSSRASTQAPDVPSPYSRTGSTGYFGSSTRSESEYLTNLKFAPPPLERASSSGCAAVRREALQQLQLESSSGSDFAEFMIPPKSPPRPLCRSKSQCITSSQTPSRLPPLQRECSDSLVPSTFSTISSTSSSRFLHSSPLSGVACSSSSVSSTSSSSSSACKKKHHKLKPLTDGVSLSSSSSSGSSLLQSSLRRRLMECCNSMADEDRDRHGAVW